eukprot:scaffold5773_cov116-Isochrysis_galbana.AAC.8
MPAHTPRISGHVTRQAASSATDSRAAPLTFLYRPPLPPAGAGRSSPARRAPPSSRARPSPSRPQSQPGKAQPSRAASTSTATSHSSLSSSPAAGWQGGGGGCCRRISARHCARAAETERLHPREASPRSRHAPQPCCALVGMSGREEASRSVLPN